MTYRETITFSEDNDTCIEIDVEMAVNTFQDHNGNQCVELGECVEVHEIMVNGEKLNWSTPESRKKSIKFANEYNFDYEKVYKQLKEA